MNASIVTDPMALRFFLLLLSGHILSDFLFQTASIARNKGRSAGALLQHGLWTFIVHAALLFPFWKGPVLLWLIGLSLVHIAIDWLKPRIHSNEGRTLAGFFLDQAFHLVTLVALSWVVTARGDAVSASLPAGKLDLYVRAMLIAAGFAFNAKGGTAVVRLILARFPVIRGHAGARHQQSKQHQHTPSGSVPHLFSATHNTLPASATARRPACLTYVDSVEAQPLCEFSLAERHIRERRAVDGQTDHNTFAGDRDKTIQLEASG